MSPSDAMLFDDWLRERNADAFKVLATRYAAMVYATCRRILNNSSEAEDVTQECFVILAATNKPIGGYLAPWLHRVAYNRSIARLRSERRRREREVRFVSEQPVARDMAWDEIGGYVDEAIAELPEKLREPIIACFLDGKTHESIAQTLGIPRSTVSFRVEKGVECLRKTLQGKGVAVTSAVLIGSMKAATSSALPPSVAANLGKLALSGASHVAVPATMTAPLGKSVLGAWTAKTLLTAAAGLALVATAGWQVHKAAYNSGVRDTQTQLSSKPAASPVVFEAPAGTPSRMPSPPVKAASVAPARKDQEKKTEVQASPEDTAANANAAAPIVVAQGGPTFLDQAVDAVSNAWDSVTNVLSGEKGRRIACANNLKQFGVVFKMFANEEPRQCFPRLNPKAGHLMFANDNPGMEPVYPEYLADLKILICPDDLPHASLMQQLDLSRIESGLTLFDNSSYIYLGYAVRSVEDLQAFADAYKDRVGHGLPFDTDLDTPRGKLFRLREGVEQLLNMDPDNPAAGAKIQSEIPVLLEVPRHDPGVGSVLFMDGHVEFMRFSSTGNFPMNEAAMKILESLMAMK